MAEKETIEFPNGFASFIETYHELTVWLTICLDSEDYPNLTKFYQINGLGGFWGLTQNLAFKFETLYEGEEWGTDKDYFETLDSFFKEELENI